jgi:hypothetical protein
VIPASQSSVAPEVSSNLSASYKFTPLALIMPPPSIPTHTITSQIDSVASRTPSTSSLSSNVSVYPTAPSSSTNNFSNACSVPTLIQ